MTNNDQGPHILRARALIYYEQTGARVLRVELKERCIRWV